VFDHSLKTEKREGEREKRNKVGEGVVRVIAFEREEARNYISGYEGS
jgi:hypothetical protein